MATPGGGESVEAYAGGAWDEPVSPDDRLKPDADAASGFSRSSGLERVA